jgi:hypothetical protein
MVAWFLILGPLILGLVGLAMLLNVFGTTDDMADFYKGRGEWFPILQGDEKKSHRLIGAVLLVGGVLTALAFLRMGVL